MKTPLEPGPGLRAGFRDLRFNANNLTAFVVSVIFSLTGAVVIFSNVATKANFTQDQAVSWISAAFIISGILSSLLSIHYKIPILAMPTLTGMLVMGPILAVFPVQQIVAGYAIAGVVYALLGISGLLGKYAKYLPLPIVMGMIAGVFMSYGTAIVTSIKTLPLIGFATVAAYLISPLFTKKIPQQAFAVVVAIVLTLIMIPIESTTGLFGITIPQLVPPSFSNLNVVLAISLPLVLVSIADLLKCYGVLKTNGYEPPINAMSFWPSGIGTIVSAFFLAPPVSMTGPITAITSDPAAGPLESRYVGSVLKSLSSIAIGLSAGFLVPFLMTLPASVTSVIAGLAMIGLFTGSLSGAFGTKKFTIGAFTAFIVALANITIWNISAAVWALIAGVVVSAFLERDHFKTLGGVSPKAPATAANPTVSVSAAGSTLPAGAAPAVEVPK